METLDLGNGAINPEESFSKEHWLSSIGLASILAGGAKPIVRAPKTPSLQDKNLILEKTVYKAHELATKTKADFHFLIEELRGGIKKALNPNVEDNLEPSILGPNLPINAMVTESVKKVLDKILSKFSFNGEGKGTEKDLFYKDSIIHIFHGEVNRKRKAVGYHHESLMGGKILEITNPPNQYGVYRAIVEIDGKSKKVPSTFFPKDWDRVQVLSAIKHAYKNKRLLKDNLYEGMLTNGMKIQMRLDPEGKIKTAYPIY
ncbi:MAG: EndoU domain-containing protein [Bacillota bacterium]